MKNSLSNLLFFPLLGAVFFMAVLLNSHVLRGVSIDLTENKIYTLSSGSVDVVEGLNEPITLYYFFSEQTSSGMTSLRDYATQVETLLRKYEEMSNGMIILEVIDPVPFSEQEDRAAQFGLTAAEIGTSGDTIYFGLAGTNPVGDTMVISFFDPSKEAFLEYDISKLIYQLSDVELAKVTVISSHSLEGGQNPLTGRGDPPNVAYKQLQELFDVTLLSDADTTLPTDTEILVVWHVKGLSNSLHSDIKQYISSGGKAVIIQDPHFESDALSRMGGVGANPSDMDLLKELGIHIASDKVVLDARRGLEIRGNQGEVITHYGYLGLTQEDISQSEVITADLTAINMASAGAISLLPTNNNEAPQSEQLRPDVADASVNETDSGLTLIPLLVTSPNANTMDAAKYATEQDVSRFGNYVDISSQQQHVIAARIQGPQIKEAQVQGQADKHQLNVVVIADADFLENRFWVQQSSFFGQEVLNAFANNADFLTNVVDNFSGADGLIGVRGRATYSRPFTVVEALSVEAEAKFRAQEQKLQQELELAEARLNE